MRSVFRVQPAAARCDATQALRGAFVQFFQRPFGNGHGVEHGLAQVGAAQSVQTGVGGGPENVAVPFDENVIDGAVVAAKFPEIAALRRNEIGNFLGAVQIADEVAYFVPPQGGDLRKFGSYDRTVDNIFIEWDRNILWTATDTGLYALSCPNLAKPVLDPMPVTESSLAKLNQCAA